MSRTRIRLASVAAAAGPDSATAQVEADCGSFYRYLTQGLGLDLRTLATLQDKTLQDKMEVR